MTGLQSFGQLLLLSLALLIAMFGRSALGPLQETIHLSLNFTDNQMAILQGAAMGVPMAVASVPVGFLCDRTSRARILKISVLTSIASILLSAFGSNFAALFAARCLAGTASAAILIAGSSVISDLFPADLRGRASIFPASGEIVGAPLSFALGGFLLVSASSWPISGLHRPEAWRTALLAMGVFLAPFAGLVFLLREPARREPDSQKRPLKAVLARLWEYRAVALPVLFARAMVWIADGAVFVWAAPVYARQYHMTPGAIGALMGVVLLFSGIAGPILGGVLADACQRWGGPRRTMIVLAGLALVSAPTALFGIMPSAGLASLMMVSFLTVGFTIATAGVSLSTIVIPGDVRGLYLGIAFTFGSIFFVGVAPLAVSLLSGSLGGGLMIGKALTIVCGTASLLGAVIFSVSSLFAPGNRPKACAIPTSVSVAPLA